MQLRPRGVWNLRAGVRIGRPAFPCKILIAGCVMVLAGCASMERPAATGQNQHATTSASASQIDIPAGFSSPRATRAPQAVVSGRRIDAPLAVQTPDDGLEPQTVDLTVQPPDIWTRIRRGFAVPNIDTSLVKEWENFYASRPDYLQRTAERAGKYLYYIVEEIDQRGMPTELALLPFVESSYDPWALSRSQASGLWQFIPATGRGFNLKQDWWRDERRDPIASTKAALDYLQYLFDFHGDWHLALASYNWGEGSVKRAMDKNAARAQPTDYLSLDMPDETRNYIPKLQAIKNIIANPSAFNIALPAIDNQPYFVTITKSRNIDVKLAAQLAEMPLEEFKALNPSFNRGVILGSHQPTLLLPADRISVFEANLRAYSGSLSSWHTHEMSRGETLTSVAKKYGTSVATLRKANGLGRRSRVGAGDILMVPTGRQPEPTLVASAGPTPVRTAAETGARGKKQAHVRTHKVRKGDTLSSIAQRYGTSVQQLRALNRVKGSTLSIGRTLQIPGTGVRG
ncbi:MAG: LysM peptidoglycan-binding domain-containing protein [Pigmentiphaga sp.]|uniref:LysM peptidoglycan-binding domain-containing protein n=1 Tax=Pigmentiphaga sp. TaxID=1977564 RepID=UPI0029BA4D29|nr:LysM peptidoglycan-binding domain-containing protein [Pigmentiphaga sp.]MDX3904715.1 LysM peptidoglycan-binding domain-containing protein [Pigmentiphaga sp.]